MKYDVFVSYSRKDMEIARSVCAVLDGYKKHYTFEYFFDTSEIKSRDEYLKRIARAINDSKVILFLAGQNSYASEFCAKELLFADKRGIRIHQYRIDDAEIPLELDMLLGTHQYREVKTTPLESFVREVLADALGCEVLSFEAAETERRKKEEIERQMRAVREREMREKIVQLEDRRHEIIEEMVECEKTLAGLTREKDFVEKDIADLRRSLAEKEDGGHGNSGAGNGVTSAQTPNEAKSVLLSIGKWFKWGLYSIILGIALLFALGLIIGARDNENESNIEVTVPTKTYKVGDYYDDGTKQGVVFAVSDDGRHGKIVSLDQADKQWCTDAQCDKEIAVGASSKDHGKVNTDKVMARRDSKEYPAFSWCRAKGKDWYLPAIEELRLLLLNDSVSDAVNSTLAKYGADGLSVTGATDWYWSSSEDDEDSVWYITMYGNLVYIRCKADYSYVRAVSAF